MSKRTRRVHVRLLLLFVGAALLQAQLGTQNNTACLYPLRQAPSDKAVPPGLPYLMSERYWKQKQIIQSA